MLKLKKNKRKLILSLVPCSQLYSGGEMHCSGLHSQYKRCRYTLCSPWGLQWWSSGHLRWNAGDSIKDSGYGPQTNLVWQTGGVLLFPDPVMNRGLESPMLSCQSGAETDWEGADSRLMLQASSVSSKTHRISPLPLLPFAYHFTQAAAPTFKSETHLGAEPKTYCTADQWSL